MTSLTFLHQICPIRAILAATYLFTRTCVPHNNCLTDACCKRNQNNFLNLWLNNFFSLSGIERKILKKFEAIVEESLPFDKVCGRCSQFQNSKLCVFCQWGKKGKTCCQVPFKCSKYIHMQGFKYRDSSSLDQQFIFNIQVKLCDDFYIREQLLLMVGSETIFCKHFCFLQHHNNFQPSC